MIVDPAIAARKLDFDHSGETGVSHVVPATVSQRTTQDYQTGSVHPTGKRLAAVGPRSTSRGCPSGCISKRRTRFDSPRSRGIVGWKNDVDPLHRNAGRVVWRTAGSDARRQSLWDSAPNPLAGIAAVAGMGTRFRQQRHPIARQLPSSILGTVRWRQIGWQSLSFRRWGR